MAFVLFYIRFYSIPVALLLLFVTYGIAVFVVAVLVVAATPYDIQYYQSTTNYSIVSLSSSSIIPYKIAVVVVAATIVLLLLLLLVSALLLLLLLLLPLLYHTAVSIWFILVSRILRSLL